ncbi:alpha-ketoglutarate-dependent dioxygenase AlkB [Marinobacterium arenosum]|uniref:alpha-ketoglutarate-dependent dioxygenase AlkB n=1 Tax=Marinobacterium arenosum TaxID=2862496 RepID=UPI001C967240|nr:alpha-ketoglutarate-dependent dioxygenase AlkB [Marinobacterium arenosum]
MREPREFRFRNRLDHSDQYSLELADGSLLIMGKGCQEVYEHAVPIDHKYLNPRINLSFRQFRWPSGLKRDSRVA